MKIFSYLFIVLYSAISFGQKSSQDFGYRHFKTTFKSDTIHILVKSKKGEEHVKKPIIFEIQGSTAVPLIVHNGKQQVTYVSLLEGFVEENYHLVIVSKPGLPLVCHKDSLTRGKYKDPKTKTYPKTYLNNNNLNYYVERNNAVVSFLKTQNWVDTTKMIVAGHSEGSTIATHMADKIKEFTHLIYSGGTPYYSRALAMIQQDRRREIKENEPFTNEVFDYWKDVIQYPFALDRNKGWNTNKGTFSFSQNENEVLKRLHIPILISYGTLDEGTPFCDMLHIETIRDKQTNFTYNAYIGLDHYYREARPNITTSKLGTDYLTNVVTDWLKWIDKN